jgi:ubiquinone/menaquinone biosynthesis C-methylase UbiE
VAGLCCRASVSSTDKDISDLGKQVPALSSALRPMAEDELRVWGGPALVRGKRVLDLGCGDGRLALGVAPYANTVVGIDPDAELITSARERAKKARLRNVVFKVGAGQSIDLPSGSLDVVILSWTL